MFHVQQFPDLQRTVRATGQMTGKLPAVRKQLANAGNQVCIIYIKGHGDGGESAGSAGPAASAGDAGSRKSTLREQALADAGVQALLDVFPAEIRDVEEM